ncbi:MAG: toll/interleukin-1 receptor domain-containing protein [Janthinobacterium lividum]
MPEPVKINVFISYSWDSREHQRWVLSLADVINSNGGNAIVDRTHLKYGGHIKTFMLKSILDVDIVLMILTPNYKRKADNLEGGAGYEYNIINDELFKVITTNEKFIPIIREGSLEMSVTNFLRGFNCVDLRHGVNYDQNLQAILKQILHTDIKNNPVSNVNISPMDDEYKEISSVVVEIKSKSFEYFQKLFVTDDTTLTTSKLSTIAQQWSDKINDYHTSFTKVFNQGKMELYEDYLEDFKNKVFAKELWTVKAALKTPDPDLARYKKDYRDANTQDIFNTVNGILNAAHSYNTEMSQHINYSSVAIVEDLQMAFLNEDTMFMNKVIGFGIRSEILHRYFPALFPIMTQPSLWAMYFICESNNEFITIEKRTREGKMRVSHNWQYPYDRFSFLMNVISIELFSWFKSYDIELDTNLRFGYVNMFLSSISDLHKADTKMLHEWVDTN